MVLTVKELASEIMLCLEDYQYDGIDMLENEEVNINKEYIMSHINISDEGLMSFNIKDLDLPVVCIKRLSDGFIKEDDGDWDWDWIVEIDDGWKTALSKIEGYNFDMSGRGEVAYDTIPKVPEGNIDLNQIIIEREVKKLDLVINEIVEEKVKRLNQVVEKAPNEEGGEFMFKIYKITTTQEYMFPHYILDEDIERYFKEEDLSVHHAIRDTSEISGKRKLVKFVKVQ